MELQVLLLGQMEAGMDIFSERLITLLRKRIGKALGSYNLNSINLI